MHSPSKRAPTVDSSGGSVLNAPLATREQDPEGAPTHSLDMSCWGKKGYDKMKNEEDKQQLAAQLEWEREVQEERGKP